MSEKQVYIMGYGIRKCRGKSVNKKVKVRKTLVIASLCLCLFVFGPHYQSVDPIPVGTKPVLAQTSDGDTQDSTSSESDEDDTPSADDIADFASEYDKDGDGEFDEPEDDEPEDDEADEVDDQDEADEADQDDEADQEDDADDSDESDDQDRENQYDDDIDGEETEDEEDEDIAHSGKNRDDIDGEASPEFRLSGYDRYRTEGSIRRLGSRAGLSPLISREERMLLEN